MLSELSRVARRAGVPAILNFSGGLILSRLKFKMADFT